MKEIWKDIEGFEGIYQISNLGQVKSLEKIDRCPNGGLFTRPEIIMKQSDSDGYKRVQLYKDGKSKQKLIHRLVCEHFVENPENKSEVHHIDFDKSNNYYLNLRWSTSKENVNYTVEAGRKHNLSNNHHNAKITLNEAIKIKEMIKDGIRVVDIHKQLSISINIIQNIKSKNSWKNA